MSLDITFVEVTLNKIKRINRYHLTDASSVEQIHDGIQQLCATPDNTKNCFRDYVRSIVDECLERNENVINLMRLHPFEMFVDNVCSGESLGNINVFLSCII